MTGRYPLAILILAVAASGAAAKPPSKPIVTTIALQAESREAISAQSTSKFDLVCSLHDVADISKGEEWRVTVDLDKGVYCMSGQCDGTWKPIAQITPSEIVFFDEKVQTDNKLIPLSSAEIAAREEANKHKMFADLHIFLRRVARVNRLNAQMVRGAEVTSDSPTFYLNGTSAERGTCTKRPFKSPDTGPERAF